VSVRRPWITGPAAPTALESERAAAFARLVDEQLDRAYRIAGVILGDGLDAEDATHDAVVVAWRAFGGLRDQARFEAWFQRILVNTCRDRLRKRRRTPVTDLDVIDPEVRRGRTGIDEVEDRVLLDRAFRRLNADQAITVALRFYADLALDDIAVRTGVPVGTVKSRLHAALGVLQAALVGPEVYDQ